MRGDQFVALRARHVARMAGGVAQPHDAGDFREARASRRASVQVDAVVAGAVIGVDVLSDQRELAHARGGEALRLRDDRGGGARDLGAARVRHDAEGAELVAAFLHGDEGGDAALAGRRRRRRRQVVELVLGGEFGVDHRAVLRARQQGGQAMETLRADHEIDRWRAADDLGAFGLRDAAGNADGDAAALLARGLLHHAQAAELGIDLLGRLLADVAGVEDDEVGVVSAGVST